MAIRPKLGRIRRVQQARQGRQTTADHQGAAPRLQAAAVVVKGGTLAPAVLRELRATRGLLVPVVHRWEARRDNRGPRAPRAPRVQQAGLQERALPLEQVALLVRPAQRGLRAVLLAQVRAQTVWRVTQTVFVSTTRVAPSIAFAAMFVVGRQNIVPLVSV